MIKAGWQLEANLKGFLIWNLKAPNQNIKNQEYLSLVGSRLGEELEDNKGQSEYVNWRTDNTMVNTCGQFKFGILPCANLQN